MRSIILHLLLLLPLGVSAEPMPAPTMDELCRAQSVIEAEYLSYERKSGPAAGDYFDPPLAKYRTIRHIHGSKVPAELRVEFTFDDGSACLVPEGWSFSERLMPREGSRWILFIVSSPETQVRTYRGDLGRVPVGSLANFLISQCTDQWNKD